MEITATTALSATYNLLARLEAVVDFVRSGVVAGP